MIGSPDRPIRAVIADDHRLVRESLVSVLTSSGACQIVGQASDGNQAILMCLELSPDIAVVDLSMPGLGGLEVVRRLREHRPTVRCLVLTMHDDEEYLIHAVRSGAAGFLKKDSPMVDLVNAIKQIANGKTYFNHEASQVLASHVGDPGRSLDDPYRNLTAREREVFHLIAEGLTTKEIARRLNISVKTAENHRSRVLEKLDAKNTAEVVRYAVKRGLAC